MIDKTWEAEFRERMEVHYDELKWLYFELYHSDEQAFDYFCTMLHDSYQARPESLRAWDRIRTSIPGWYKSNGLGTRFMRSAFDMARAQGKSIIWLGVWEHNEAALAFYKRMGFAQFGSHDFMLGADRQTDLLMEAAVDRLV